MAKLLVIFRNNWADEMNVEGFAIIEEDIWDKIVSNLKNVYEKQINIEVFIGTNESLIFDNFNKYINSFFVSNMTDLQSRFILNSFPSWCEIRYVYGKDRKALSLKTTGFGVFPLLNWDEDYEGEEVKTDLPTFIAEEENPDLFKKLEDKYMK